MYKKDLFSILSTNGTAWFEWEGKRYILHAIERESGSGYQFNLRVSDEQNVYSTIYIMTLD